MKTNFLLILASISILLSSCKGKEKQENQEETKIQTKEFFSVDLEVIAPKADDFGVYYTEDQTINFTGDKVAWKGVFAKPNKVQTVTFDFPEEVMPTNIRFDLGNNKKQDDLVLQNFKLNYYDKSFKAQGSDFFKYFSQNDSIKFEIDSIKGTIKFLKNTNSIPYYFPKQALLDEIKKITK
jgi:hypothetical protein